MDTKIQKESCSNTDDETYKWFEKKLFLFSANGTDQISV